MFSWLVDSFRQGQRGVMRLQAALCLVANSKENSLNGSCSWKGETHRRAQRFCFRGTWARARAVVFYALSLVRVREDFRLPKKRPQQRNRLVIPDVPEWESPGTAPGRAYGNGAGRGSRQDARLPAVVLCSKKPPFYGRLFLRRTMGVRWTPVTDYRSLLWLFARSGRCAS